MNLLTLFAPGSRLARGWSAAGVSFLLGGLAVLAFAPFEQFWLMPLVLALLFQLLRLSGSWRAGARLGWAFGLGLFLAGVSWIYVSLSTFGEMPALVAALATLVFCAYLALFPALLGGLFCRFLPERIGLQALLFAGLLALLDALRGWLFTGFPWLALGYSQMQPSPLAGFAPLLGVYGLSLLVGLVGAWLCWRPWGWAGIAGLLLAGGALQRVEWTIPEGAPVSVALIQGNIPQEMKWQPERFYAILELYRSLIEQHPAQLTILPETALPAFIEHVPQDYLVELKTLARRRQGDILLGAASGNDDSYWNSAISLGATPLQTYSKSHLVPFGEYIPPGFAWFLAMARIPMSSFSAGELPQPALRLAGQRVAVNICYEDVFGREIIQSLPQASLLVNMSNTAWFGHSLAQPQHLQIARMRALETGRPMLRATNTGMTAVVGPDGRVQAVLEPFTRGVLETKVLGYQGQTPYVRWGDWLALGLSMLMLWPVLWKRKRRLAPSITA